tara:strand:+ start:651 stop:842 length:192 start_codon:yes stop_codon:yes gene_type:complete
MALSSKDLRGLNQRLSKEGKRLVDLHTEDFSLFEEEVKNLPEDAPEREELSGYFKGVSDYFGS